MNAALTLLVLSAVPAAPVPKEPPFALRTDPPPREWKLDEINDGLPYRWEKGTVHLLAWETVADDRPHEYTQILVLKQFGKPTDKGGHRWVLAQLFRNHEQRSRPWEGPFRVPPPVPPGKKAPQLMDAQVFGHEFYDDPPTDEEIKTFLRETMWTPQLGTEDSIVSKRKITTRLAAGGIDRALWKKVLGRGVPVKLFPELTKAQEKE